ncbi:MAG: helix-turn-helix domain-containing protein [Bryobacterales bacterium]|nr:helix-turn-helix domain-containing protein [Bryobacterales bacterium]
MPAGMQDRGRRATKALQESVRALPSTMARLVFLSGLRDLNTGSYRIPMVCSATERAEVDRLLRGLHEEAFSTWLNYGLEPQKADLDLYFSGLDCAKTTAIKAWLRLRTYPTLVPAAADTVQRRLFQGDLDLLLHVMADEVRPVASAPSRMQREQAESTASLLTTKDLSKWLMVPARTLRLWAEISQIPSIKVGRQWRFESEAVREWLRKRRSGTLADSPAAARKLRQ